jgi:hypothetical protein
MAQGDILDAVEKLIRDNQRAVVAEGRIESAAKDGIAYVRFNGSAYAQRAYTDKRLNPALSIGDKCVAIRPTRTSEWVIVAAYGTRGDGKNVATGTGQIRQIGGPNSLRASATTSLLIWEWDAPTQVPVTYEVQLSSSAQDMGVVPTLVTRGSYFLFVPPNTNTWYARVRSVAPDGDRSDWTGWLGNSVTNATGLTSRTFQTAFQYDVTPRNSTYTITLGTVPAGWTVRLIKVIFDIWINKDSYGYGGTIWIGDLSWALLSLSIDDCAGTLYGSPPPASDGYPSGIYEIAPERKYASQTDISVGYARCLGATVGGPTQGSVRIFMEVENSA